MSDATFLVGDVRQRMAELPDHSFDLIITSPPFLALRSYLPDDHPDKALEIGSEATPAEFLDTMLALTAEWRRLLAPHGSLAIELGDTYAGSGGAGGDYNPDGLRDGQPRFRQRNDGGQYGNWPQGGTKHNLDMRPITGGAGWPLDKSLTGIPQAYMLSLIYGYNVLDRRGPDSPAGRWRIRNLKPWIRSNPPVGALGDKERPATSYITVACVAGDRWFDLDAVRTAARPSTPRDGDPKRQVERDGGLGGNGHLADRTFHAEGGAPPLDWTVDADLIIDHTLDQRAGKYSGWSAGPTRTGKSTDDEHRGGNWSTLKGNTQEEANRQVGARGVHIRRALQTAGILPQMDAYDISPKGYAGAHYAVWPPALVQRLIDEMCPRKVCVTCGEPSRRITETPTELRERHADFAATLREHRKTAGMSQTAVDTLFGFNGMCSHWERRINGPKSQPSYPTPEQWRQLRTALAIETDEYDGLIDGYRRWQDRELDPEYREAIERTRAQGFYASTGNDGNARVGVNGRSTTSAHRTLGWSDCGHHTWRPGRVSDPFVGSGTTLAVASGMARDSVGIDLDYVNASLALERVGMFLTVDWPPGDLTLPALGPADPTPGHYDPWPTDDLIERMLGELIDAWFDQFIPHPEPAPAPRRNGRRPAAEVPGQLTMETT